MPVKAANRYEFEIWAKATEQTKLVLRVVHPGVEEKQTDSATRPLVASWDKLPARWRRYTTRLTPRADGQLELQIVAPSSHGSPPGGIWIDDVALREIEMPSVATVSDGGFNDDASMAAATDGSIYVAWNSFRNDPDSLSGSISPDPSRSMLVVTAVSATNPPANSTSSIVHPSRPGSPGSWTPFEL